jgi:hypothetical protein
MAHVRPSTPQSSHLLLAQQPSQLRRLQQRHNALHRPLEVGVRHPQHPRRGHAASVCGALEVLKRHRLWAAQGLQAAKALLVPLLFCSSVGKAGTATGEQQQRGVGGRVVWDGEAAAQP